MNIESLPMETQFQIAQFNAQVEHMSVEQLRQMLKFTHEHLQLQKHGYNELLKKFMLPESLIPR